MLDAISSHHVLVVISSSYFLTLWVVGHLSRIRKTLRIKDMTMSIDLRPIEDVHGSN
jgi:hypothetical protein